MVPTRKGVLALLSLAIGIRAAPAGMQKRQIEILPPRQSVSWEMDSPEPTEEPHEPVFPSKPTDEFSLGTPSGWISWETSGPGPTVAPEEPDYPPPAKPTDEFSIGKPSFWISWATNGPEPTSEPETPEYPPSKPSDQISIGKPSFSITWDGGGPGASSTLKPEPTSTPQPVPPPKPTSEHPPVISLPPIWANSTIAKPTPSPPVTSSSTLLQDFLDQEAGIPVESMAA
ncbi:hypothetical protein DDE82_000904 [Stemphylium lycopersici]|uniref:Uncharacterized protein n=1 Tax=Stemphylium lycopersici TaxID=183478 RepID=A0A364NED5_STELY|nr:hypothetical protein DDE82_000904 [Stemphylium lycopersici]RAR15674.1 hypothetical protein DDE83_000906 [Stemphylium lycopersici]